MDAQRRLRILKGHFRTFLNDTSGFYMRLILKLVAIHGLRTMETALNRTFRTEIVPLSETEKKGLPTASGVPGEKDGAAQAVCRLLMYLGDLGLFFTADRRPNWFLTLKYSHQPATVRSTRTSNTPTTRQLECFTAWLAPFRQTGAILTTSWPSRRPTVPTISWHCITIFGAWSSLDRFLRLRTISALF